MRGTFEDLDIERFALVADAMVRELEAVRLTARTNQYDRQSTKQIDYAIRAVRRVADRIRALKGVQVEGNPATDNTKITALALSIARDVRPLISGMAKSQWRQDMLARLDELGV